MWDAELQQWLIMWGSWIAIMVIAASVHESSKKRKASKAHKKYVEENPLTQFELDLWEQDKGAWTKYMREKLNIKTYDELQAEKERPEQSEQEKQDEN